ncbi:Fic family protein [Geofilum rubicundum]|uniref:Fic family protein n=1 Tax=Geofilum rubicundum TaxID=472113 RepID=UPI0007812B1E|nr:Fic family protein [Geofilum rubicundum]
MLLNELLKDTFKLIEKYNSFNIKESIDGEKYIHYSIVHHSTSIEGSSLTEEETQLLLDDNVTAKGKPIEHHHMQLNHYQALLFIIEKASEKSLITPSFLKEVAGKVMKDTGGIHNTIMGVYDSSKGDFRLQNVHAGVTRFADYTKVPHLVDVFCNELNSKLQADISEQEALITSFDAHFNLVSIHPFRDGNGRVSRLMMNYVQHFHNLPLSNVFKEDKADYYKALVDTRASQDMDVFRKFMLLQYSKMLNIEIDKVLSSQQEHVIKKKPGKGFGMSMMF